MNIREKAFEAQARVKHDSTTGRVVSWFETLLVVPLSDAEAMERRAEAAEDALRSLASWLSVGGYNTPTVDAAVFEQKIRDGVNQMIKAEVARWTDARRKDREHSEAWAEAIASVTPPKEKRPTP